MPFHRHDSPRTIELTSLIDIVFLLLIFFLVSFSFSVTGDVSESKTFTEMDLPRTDTDVPLLLEDRLSNLLIQVVPDTVKPNIAHRIYVLWPSLADTSKITRREAYKNSLRDSTFADLKHGFLDLDKAAFAALPASSLIADSIDRYLLQSRHSRSRQHPMVEVRADRNTEFKIIDFIMERCSLYQDIVPQIIIRTAP